MLEIEPDDEITRFATKKRQTAVNKDGFVKHQVFMPPALPQPYETSVYCTTSLTQAEVYTIGDDNITARGRPVVGRVITDGANIYDRGLQFNYNNEPLRHANIIGWSDHVDGRKSKAQALASKSKFEDMP